MNEAVKGLLETIGLIVTAGGGLTIIAYQIFKHLGAKWLDTRFDEGLKKLVHEQNKEIEKLKADLTRTFDRAQKLHHREFEVLPEVWAKINEAHWNASALLSPLQTYPDIDRMEPAQAEEFISKCDLADWQKEQLRKEKRRTDYYFENIYWHRTNSTMDAIRKASNSLGKLGIFIQDDIKSDCKALIELMWSALKEDEINHGHKPIPRLSSEINKFNQNGQRMKDDIEQRIHQRLWTNG